jgi:hypothetical protein
MGVTGVSTDIPDMFAKIGATHVHKIPMPAPSIHPIRRNFTAFAREWQAINYSNSNVIELI